MTRLQRTALMNDEPAAFAIQATQSAYSIPHRDNGPFLQSACDQTAPSVYRPSVIEVWDSFEEVQIALDGVNETRKLLDVELMKNEHYAQRGKRDHQETLACRSSRSPI
jgi:hypothetical protein